MRKSFSFLTAIALAVTALLPSCKKEDKPDPSQPIISLSSYKYTGKSGQELTVTVHVTAPNGFKDLIITKGVNLQPDADFGTGGKIEVTGLSGSTSDYEFQYTLDPDEVDKLVGFNFRLEDSKGLASEKDFTLNTTVSGAQILYTYRWSLKSKMWLTTPPVENIEDCARDDSYLFNRDSTMEMVYGNSACTYDGLNVYDKWTLSPAEDTLMITYHNVFDPTQITTEVYHVTTLNKDKLVMSMAYDLTIFGLSDHEIFEYTYEGSPK